MAKTGTSVAMAAALLAATTSALAGSAPAAHAITRIVVEHDCFGCATGWSLVLDRDGTATHTVTGNPRHGTEDKVSTGSIGAREFDRLAALLVSRGFFALENEYGDPATADGPWTSVAALRDGVEKKVVSRGEAGPPPLRAITKELTAIKVRLRLPPSPAP
jgi:hypothetical protein